VRPPVDHIAAPPFPARARWVNVASQRMVQQRGGPVLIEFWDFCRPNSIRTLPYLKAWDARYRDAGLRVIGVHAAGFPPSEAPENVEAAVERLGITYPVLIDTDFELWQEYENLGWPARYLWNAEGRLADFHYGEGAYAETELAIADLLGLAGVDPVAPVRPEDAAGAVLSPQSEDVAGAWNGPYEAGSVWGVFDGSGVATVNGATIAVPAAGAVELIRHEISTQGMLELSVSAGLTCLATCFAPGLAGS
jgi:thiol-disulfide isomerase/thioredoxin